MRLHQVLEVRREVAKTRRLVEKIRPVGGDGRFEVPARQVSGLLRCDIEWGLHTEVWGCTLRCDIERGLHTEV